MKHFFLTRRDYFVLYQLAFRNDLQQCPSSLFPIRNYLGVANSGKMVVSLLYFHQLSPDNIGVINEFMGKNAWVAAIYNVFQLLIYMLEHGFDQSKRIICNNRDSKSLGCCFLHTTSFETIKATLVLEGKKEKKL